MTYQPSNDWEADWERAEPMLASALDHSPHEYTLAGIRLMLREGHCDLWVGEKSAAVVEVDTELMVLQVWLAGGEMAEVMAGMRDVENWGRTRNFRRVMIYGRKGWERVLSKAQYQHKWTVLEKELWVE